jgi:23S rRNA (cytosine1962-C5)-methyltransferase
VTAGMQTSPAKVPCTLYEDEHLLAVNKPAGINTHRSSEEAPWGMVEVLQNRRPDLPKLGIHQRLDRDTSGVLLFAKSAEANRSLSSQFENHRVQKKYYFVTRGKASDREFTATEPIEGKSAKTSFRKLEELFDESSLWEARPETGRTHQIRIHSAQKGIPILGDDTAMEPLLLHAARLEFQHPVAERSFILEAPTPSYFKVQDRQQRLLQVAECLRKSLISPNETNVYRWIHKESDGFPALTVDRLNEWLYVEEYGVSDEAVLKFCSVLKDYEESFRSGMKGLILSRAVQGSRRENKRLVWGETLPGEIEVVENGVRYFLDAISPGGTGLFLDQRENRRLIRELSRKKRVLNLFAYTCGFSVCAAMGGADETVSVDLSRSILERGRRNFTLNGLEPSAHRFLADDVMDVLKKFSSKKERFDIIVIDPPSFSRSKTSGVFSIKRDFKQLIGNAAGLLNKGGWLFASTNHADWKFPVFLSTVLAGIQLAKKRVVEKRWGPQSFDFPVVPSRPAHLKAIWLRLE